MTIVKKQADLFCLHCQKNTMHEITYAGNRISDIECLECKTELEVNDEQVISHYMEEILHRLKTKPIRVSQDMQGHRSKYILSLPYRLVRKFVKLTQDIREFRRYIKNRHKR